MEPDFSEFSGFGESDKSLKHELESIGNIATFVSFVRQFRNDCLVSVCDIRILL